MTWQNQADWLLQWVTYLHLCLCISFYTEFKVVKVTKWTKDLPRSKKNLRERQRDYRGGSKCLLINSCSSKANKIVKVVKKGIKLK